MAEASHQLLLHLPFRHNFSSEIHRPIKFNRLHVDVTAKKAQSSAELIGKLEQLQDISVSTQCIHKLKERRALNYKSLLEERD
jgi:hypothetical protein